MVTSPFGSSVDPNPAPLRPAELLPRYRRPLTFGAILDETFRLFRRAWRPLMLTVACGAIPYTVLLVLISGWLTGSALSLSAATSTATASGQIGPLFRTMGALYAGIFGSILVYVLCLIPSFAGVVALTDGALRGVSLPVSQAIRRGLRATPAIVGLGLLGVLLGLALTIAATPLFLLGVFGVLGSLVALIGLLVWWLNSGARKPWLCWLIILATPFGLPIYCGYRWYLGVAAIVLERSGVTGALRRSWDLTRGQWFRVFGAFTVVGIVVAVLQAIPGWIVSLIAAAVGVAYVSARQTPGEVVGLQGLLTIGNAISAAARSLGVVLFGALPFITLTLLFEDLRNRQEGADLAERLTAVEATDPTVASPPPAAP